ncbi:MAG TPA: hypothetical protein VLX85_05460 [Stellaceae bacterium]|nr:hypothetical protein [Stellaceae bacterium]
MPIISQVSVQVSTQPYGPLIPPLDFYLSDGIAGQILNINPLAFVLQNLSPSIIGQTFTRSSGPEFTKLVGLLTQAPDPSGKLLLSFNLGASPPGAGSIRSEGFTVDEFVPGGIAPNLDGACFVSFDLHVSDFSQSAPDANGKVSGSITVEFMINGCYVGPGVTRIPSFFHIPCFVICLISRIIGRKPRYIRRH